MLITWSMILDLIVRAIVPALTIGICTYFLNKVRLRIKKSLTDYKDVKSSVLGTDTRRSLLEYQQQLDQDLTEIKKELKTTGGSSLRDAVTSTMDTTQLILGLIQASSNHSTSRVYLRTDEKGMLVWSNHTYSQWAGRPDVELLGLRWFTLVYAHDRENLKQEYLSAIADGRSLHTEFRMWMNKSQTYEVVRCILDPIFSPSNTVLGWYGYLTRIQ